MVITYSVHQCPIRFSEERWAHIRHRHPELESYKDLILKTVAEPALIQEGDFGEKLAVQKYENLILGTKYLVVIYKEVDRDDGFVVTAYITRAISKNRRIIWTR